MKKITDVLKSWWLILLFGIVSTFFGIWLLTNRGAGFNLTKIILIVDFLFIGISSILGALSHKDTHSTAKFGMFGGVLTLICGLLLVATPLLPESFMMFLFAFGFVFSGLQGIFASIAMKKVNFNGWILTLIISILLFLTGLSLAGNPLVAFLAIDIITGCGVLITGIDLIYIGIKMHSVKKELER